MRKCSNGEWIPADSLEYRYAIKGCTEKLKGSLILRERLIDLYCDGEHWQIFKDTLKTGRPGEPNYLIVRMGEKMWMAENLNYADSEKSWCYEYKESNCDVTGRYYTWAAAIDSVALANDKENPQTCGYGAKCTLPTVVKGVCPDGWHLPADWEWKTLISSVGEIKELLSIYGWKNVGTDSYGFSALPAGFRVFYGPFFEGGLRASNWSSSQIDNAKAFSMYFYEDGVNHNSVYYSQKEDNFSTVVSYAIPVRCLQNN